MGKKNAVVELLPKKKKSKGHKVIKVLLAFAAINGAIKLYSMYRETKDDEKGRNDGNEVKVYKAFMNGRSVKLDGEKVQGIFVKACMAGIDLDLRNAIITEDVFITCKSVMSGISVRVPDGINVVLEGKNILSGMHSSVPEAIDKVGPTVFIDADNVLSGLSVQPANKSQKNVGSEVDELDNNIEDEYSCQEKEYQEELNESTYQVENLKNEDESDANDNMLEKEDLKAED